MKKICIKCGCEFEEFPNKEVEICSECQKWEFMIKKSKNQSKS